jgi:hypothetical protein
MRIDERIVIQIPKHVQEATRTKRNTWIRHSILRAVWDIRNRLILDSHEDIFGLFRMTDCIEINIRGELETRDVSMEKWYSVRTMFNQRKKKEEGW